MKNIIYLSLILQALLLSACNKSQTEKQAAKEATIESPTQQAAVSSFDKNAERPNIVFILADDLGIGQVGAYKENKISTPNIDTLAEEGMRFTQAYAGNTVCSPSRSSLFLGQDGRLLHSNDNGIKLRKQDFTFAHALQNAGYETALIGKYGIGETLGENDPMTMGFDQWFGYMGNLEAHRHYPKELWRNNKLISLPENQEGKKGKLAHDLFTEEAIKYLHKERQKPFFLFLAYTFPHAELAAPENTLSLYKDKFEETPYPGMSTGKAIDRFTPYYPEPVDQPRATLAAMISAIDRDVGLIQHELEVLGLDKNTLIIFTSDNGPHHEGGADPIFFDASAPYRGMKRDLYDGGIHVPFIAYWPDKIKASESSTPIAFFDILPTFAELAGSQLNNELGEKINGQSFARVMTKQEQLEERKLYWEFRVKRGSDDPIHMRQAARQGKWKAVRYGSQNKVELFDISQDLAEENNLAEKESKLAADFKSFFDKQLEQ